MDGGVTKERVLIVDDEPQILVALEDLLSDDFTVVKSSSPENALSVVESDPNIAVVLTDQRMPRMTGDELLSRMTFASAVGIMVSGFADLPAVIRAINEGKVFAYVTEIDNKPLSINDLRSFLKNELPDYMVPASISVLSSLPLSPTGKVDRSKLPAPVAVVPQSTAPAAAPKSEIESQLLGIWRQVLASDTVGVDAT